MESRYHWCHLPTVLMTLACICHTIVFLTSAISLLQLSVHIYATSVHSRHSICWDSSQSGTPSLPLWTTDHHGRIVIGNWNIWRPLPLSPPLLASSARNWCHPRTVTLGCHTKASWLISLWASERVCEELDKPLNTVCWTLKDKEKNGCYLFEILKTIHLSVFILFQLKVRRIMKSTFKM